MNVMLLICSCLLFLPFSAGCRKNPAPTAYCPAPAAGPGRTEKEAYWRRQYDNNRPDAPKSFQVPPKAPRNNQFGEFNDDLYHGLDSQPELAALPADAYRPGPSPIGGFPPPPSFAVEPLSGPAATATNTRASFNPAPAGLQTQEHFYPVEQLVYGGDYPDIDRPELYRLMPKDVVTITVKDHPEFSGQMEIQPDGTIRIPNAPDIVSLRGLTGDEAAEKLRSTLVVYIKGECKVRVQTNRARGGYYFVFGDVLQPGRFPMGLEPIRLSEAVLAANWEANPGRRDLDGDELGPSFPTASPRGKFVSPGSADLARVMLITPHRSQPVRTVHDVRSALYGVTAGDPILRPGQIVVVPSLIPERNQNLGVELSRPTPMGEPGASANAVAIPPEGKMPGQGFSYAGTPSRLPEVLPAPARGSSTGGDKRERRLSDVENNMANAFETSHNNSGSTMHEASPLPYVTGSSAASPRGGGWRKGF